jgi:hypothetical protein
VSKEQPCRNEDNAFLPLRRRQLSVRCVTRKAKKRRAKRQKDFATEPSGVLAAPGSLLAHFLAAKIRDYQ